MAAPPYICKACKLAVFVRPGKEPIRACTCQAPIIATCEAVAHGRGAVKG